MKRRNLLAILGGTVGVAGIGGYLYLNHGQDPEELRNLERPSPENELESAEKPSTVPDTSRDVVFLSEPISEPVPDSDRFESIDAEPSDQGSGDRIRLDMNPGVDLSEEAEKIRLILDVGTDQTAESEIDGETVTFRGEETEEGAVLVGTHEAGSPAVLLARGESMETAERLLNGWNSL